MRDRSTYENLTTIALSPTLAASVAELPKTDQAALVRMVHDIGEAGFYRLVHAVAPGGRRSDYPEREPLLKQMAAEMRAQHPHLGGIGGNWRKGADAAAAKVTRSLPDTRGAATKKWLTRQWKQHGKRLLQEHRATEAIAGDRQLRAWHEMVQHGLGANSFQALVNQTMPEFGRTSLSRLGTSFVPSTASANPINGCPPLHEDGNHELDSD
jgi:hypothetical protein